MLTSRRQDNPENQHTSDGPPITVTQRKSADRWLTLAARCLTSASEVRNLSQHTSRSINEARDSVSLAETHLANQPAAIPLRP